MFLAYPLPMSHQLSSILMEHGLRSPTLCWVQGQEGRKLDKNETYCLPSRTQNPLGDSLITHCDIFCAMLEVCKKSYGNVEQKPILSEDFRSLHKPEVNSSRHVELLPSKLRLRRAFQVERLDTQRRGGVKTCYIQAVTRRASGQDIWYLKKARKINQVLLVNSNISDGQEVWNSSMQGKR